MSSGGRNNPRYDGNILELAAEAASAYQHGDLERTIRCWEEAHALALETGDTTAAADAAVHVAIHLMIDTGFLAPVRGWTRRASRLLEGVDEGPLHAWVAVLDAYERFLSGDYAEAHVAARRAIVIGSASAAPEPLAMARLAEARSLIVDGEVEAGLGLLDEVGAAVLSGDLSAVAAGIVYCELVCAFQSLSLHDQAEEWTAAMERWAAKDAIGSFGGRCRVHRAELLRLRGSIGEAEEEAVRACDELRPYLRLEFGWPLTELGRIRLRRGDHAGASDALAAARDIGWDAEPWWSLLLLSSGRNAEAALSIRDALARPGAVTSKELPPNTSLRRAPLLDAAVEIFVAAGDLDSAVSASTELTYIAERFGAPALSAAAAIARGRIALSKGDRDGAASAFEDGMRLWGVVGSPDDRAIARELLAQSVAPSRPTVAPSPANGAIFRHDGDIWRIGWLDGVVLVKDMRGFSYLARLLGAPGHEFHVLDLASGSDLGDAGPLLDDVAKQMYKRRLEEIDEDIASAEDLGDHERSARASVERDYLLRELARAVGLDGRDRRAGATSERARAGVTRAIRLAIKRIAAHDASMGEHLDRTIRTGTYCAYTPDPRAPVSWQL